MLEQWINKLNELHPMPEGLTNELISIMAIKQFPKKEILLSPGQTANYACFILKGLVRAYYIAGDGEEITSRIMDENFVLTSWISFYTGKPTDEYLQTIEDTELGCIHYNDLQNQYKNYLEFNIIGRKLTDYFLYLSEQRTRLLRKHTAEEKYNLFLEYHPYLLQRASLRYIATYLGISEETLSRIRAKKMH